MQLTPSEQDRLLLFTAAELARARRARGLRLNVPETVALVADTAAEVARDGGRLADAIEAGRAVLGPDDVLPGVSDVVDVVTVEAVFDDGTRLIVVPDPVGGHRGGPHQPGAAPYPPGAVLLDDEDAEMPRDPGVVTVAVTNTADVPISVTSHFHFFEVNPRLRFDRAAAYGTHLAVPAGSAVRFDPGATVEVALAPIGGARVVVGFAGLVDGPLDAPGAKRVALAKAAATGFLGAGAAEPRG
jgi:urease subunit gamma/beta